MCEEDFSDKKKPVQWEEAIKKLRGEVANNLVIQAFSDVMHQEVVIPTVHGVRGFVIIVILPLTTAAAAVTTTNDDGDDDDDDNNNWFVIRQLVSNNIFEMNKIHCLKGFSLSSFSFFMVNEFAN